MTKVGDGHKYRGCSGCGTQLGKSGLKLVFVGGARRCKKCLAKYYAGSKNINEKQQESIDEYHRQLRVHYGLKPVETL